MRSYIVKENYVGLVILKIFWYMQTDRKSKKRLENNLHNNQLFMCKLENQITWLYID